MKKNDVSSPQDLPQRGCQTAVAWLYNNTVCFESLSYALTNTAVYWVSANGFFTHLLGTGDSLLTRLFLLEQPLGRRIGYGLFFGFCMVGVIAVMCSTALSSYRKILFQLRPSLPESAVTKLNSLPYPGFRTGSRYIAALFKTVICISSVFALVHQVSKSMLVAGVVSGFVAIGFFIAQLINLSKEGANKNQLSYCGANVLGWYAGLVYGFGQSVLLFNQADQLRMRMGCSSSSMSSSLSHHPWEITVFSLHLLWLSAFLVKTGSDYYYRTYCFWVKRSDLSAALLDSPVQANSSCCRSGFFCNIKATPAALLAASYKCVVSVAATLPVIYYALFVKPYLQNQQGACFPEVDATQFMGVSAGAFFLMLLSFRPILSQLMPQRSLCGAGVKAGSGRGGLTVSV